MPLAESLTDALPANLPAQLSARLQRPLPGDEVRERFAPALSYGRHFGPPAHDARIAAVTILLHQRDGEWHVPFTVRPDTMAAHAGQISLPGGMVEAGETSPAAALRELHEELGVTSASVEVLGSLSPLYVFVSNFLVTPWVMAARQPLTFHPCRREVARVLDVPLARLLAPGAVGTHRQQRGAMAFTVPHIAYGEHQIWGATSLILGELLEVVRQSVAEP